MLSVVRLQEDYSAEELRTHVRSKDLSQSRHLLSPAAVRDGMDRAAVAKIGSMDRQTLRDWVHRFNASGCHRQAATGWEGALALEMRPLILFSFADLLPTLKVPSPDVEPVGWCGIVKTLV
jgi:hypothetical protein